MITYVQHPNPLIADAFLLCPRMSIFSFSFQTIHVYSEGDGETAKVGLTNLLTLLVSISVKLPAKVIGGFSLPSQLCVAIVKNRSRQG